MEVDPFRKDRKIKNRPSEPGVLPGGAGGLPGAGQNDDLGERVDRIDAKMNVMLEMLTRMGVGRPGPTGDGGNTEDRKDGENRRYRQDTGDTGDTGDVDGKEDGVGMGHGLDRVVSTLPDDTSVVWGLQGGSNKGDVETPASDASASIAAAAERTRKRRESHDPGVGQDSGPQITTGQPVGLKMGDDDVMDEIKRLLVTMPDRIIEKLDNTPPSE